MCILLLPCALRAQSAGDTLFIGVNHSPAGNERDTRIENIMNRAAVMELEKSGLKGIVMQDTAEEFTPKLMITGWYLEQKDMLKLEYQLQEGTSGEELAVIQIDTPITHFLDRTVAQAVKELLHESRDQISRIAREMPEGEPTVVAERTESEAASGERSEPELKPAREQQPRRVEAEARVSGAYMLGRAAEHLPYGVLLEGRVSYPVVQREHLAWRLGGSAGVLRIFPAVDYKADYIKTLVPLGLLTEVSLKQESGWIFKLWWTAGAALRPPHENEVVDKLLAPAFPYTSMGIGAQVPLNSDEMWLVTGLSGLGLFSPYEASATDKVNTETTMAVNIDLGIVWRM